MLLGSLHFFDRVNSPDHTIWNKVYESALAKKSFASMENAYLNNVEDLYESIIIAFYAKRIMTVKKSHCT